MGEPQKTFGCVQGDAPQGAASQGPTKGMGGEPVKKPAKPKPAKKPSSEGE